MIPTVPNWQLHAAPVLPVRPWTAGVGMLASHRARVVESADRPSEDMGTRRWQERGSRQVPARPSPTRTGWPRSSWSAVEKEFTAGGHDVRAVERVDLRDRRGRVLLAARPVGLRQDHHPADDRRLRGADQRPDPAPRPRHGRRPALPARRQHGLPAVRALPPHGRLRERGLRPAAQEGRQGRDQAAGGRGAGPGRAGGPREAQAAPAVGRPAAAGRPGPGAGQPATGPAAGRAARRPRPQAAPGHAARAETDPARGRHHLRLRDPRPGGGADHVRPAGGDERRPDRAARQPARAVRAPRHPVRGQLHRDLEHPHRPARAQGRRLGAGRAGPGPAGAGRRRRRRPARARTSSWPSGPRRSCCGPSRTRPRPTAAPLRVKVDEVVYLGTSTQYRTVTDGGDAVAVYRQNASATPGADVLAGQVGWLEWPPEHSYVLGGGTKEETLP